MFARVISKAGYYHLVVDGYKESQIRFFDREAEKKLRELYMSFYERAMRDYKLGVLSKPPKPIEEVVREIESEPLALVIEGKRREGVRTRIRLPRGIELIEGVYVLESVYGECSANNVIDFVVLRPCKAVDVIKYLRKEGLIDEKIASHMIEVLGESGSLDLVDLAAQLAEQNTSATIMLHLTRPHYVALKIEAGKRIKLAVQPGSFLSLGERGARKAVAYNGSETLGASLLLNALVAWYSNREGTIVIARRVF